MTGKVAVSWSGGKDSCLALELVRERGLDVACLVCMLDEHGERTRSHGQHPRLIEAQARSLGVELRLPRAGWSDYEREFVTTLRGLHSSGITQVVFGDIDLDDHRAWEERVCAEAGLEAVLPLWQWDRLRVVDEVLHRGIDAICVAVNEAYLPASFCGRRYDRSFIADLPATVDACGERGEFHSLVVDAPGFREAIPAFVRQVHRVEVGDGPGGGRYAFAELALASDLNAHPDP